MNRVAVSLANGRSNQQPMRRQLLWAVWTIGMLTWTYLLVVPVEWLPKGLRFPRGTGTVVFSWSKLGHAAAYATLVAYALALSRNRRRDWLFLVPLSLHAFGTELIQTWVPSRSGSWTDVAIDHVGIVTGLGLRRLSDWVRYRLWSLARRSERVPPAPDTDPRAGDENPHTDPLRNG
jgi:VanZ family protein